LDKESQHKVTLTKDSIWGLILSPKNSGRQYWATNPSYFRNEAKLPVERVSWEDCQVFINILRTTDKKPYRLPSEAEWEYACRAGTTTPFYFGETISTDQANYDGSHIYGRWKEGRRSA